jgi:type IV pilus assembly protein PilC
MLGGGISLVDSIGIASHAVPNKFLFQKMKNLPDHIKNGESLYQSLHHTGFFPALALDMIRIGESSASLDSMLIDVAEVYNHQIQMKIDRFVSLIEPVIIIVMGLLVAGMLLSVYLPIFNIIRVTG